MTQVRPRTNLRRFLIGSVVSVLIAATVTVLLAGYFAEDLARWTMIRRLCSDDELTRQQAVSYVIRNEDDPAVVEGIVARLDGADGKCFDRLVATLSTIGAWGPNVGRPWVRYLQRRVDSGVTIQRASIAVELGKALWHRRPYHDDPGIAGLVEKLLTDKAPDVRLNALSAAACLPDPKRTELIRRAVDDDEPAVAERARQLLSLLEGRAADPAPTVSLDDAAEAVKRLVKLEAMDEQSAPISITDDMPHLVRLQAVRVSTLAEPGDLLSVFDADQPTTRDLACLIARQRFDDDQCRTLAKQLVGSFVDNQRFAGAILGGMVPADEELMQFLNTRAEQDTSWVMAQHYNLALTMQGQPVQGFAPAALLAHQKMPRTSVTLALMHMGQLDGVDWMLNPFGEPPVALHLLFDQLRYAPVLHHYFPRMPRFDLWTDVEHQKQQVERIRDWYLLFRPALRFDDQRKIFTTEASE